MVSKVNSKMKPKLRNMDPPAPPPPVPALNLSKNSSPYLNGSVAMATTQPTNPSELQLYRVLQRANLLQYYETFITQGGDDVQQLCEAGEEEFLEIMALVGMASKPLHVRRLQKSLQEWVANPTADLSMFQQGPLAALTPPPAPPGSIVASVQGAVAGAVAYAVQHAAGNPGVISAPTWNPRPVSGGGGGATTGSSASASSSSAGTSGANSSTSTSATSAAAVASALTSTNLSMPSSTTPSVGHTGAGTPSPPPQPLSAGGVNNATSVNSSSTPIEFVPSPAHSTGGLDTPKNSPSPSNGIKRDSSSPTPMPVLSDSQIKAISEAAERVAKALPPLGPKPMNTKKQICKEIEDLILMTPDHPERMDLLRKYAAIYGRFDSKRKNEKPMSLHEISVNEAAAQLCAHNTALLTRREELFPLARTVVRDSGYQYAKGHSRAQNELSGEPPSKRCKISMPGRKGFKSELEKIHSEERLAEIHATLTSITAKQEDLKARLAEDSHRKSPLGGPCSASPALVNTDGVESSIQVALQTELDALTTQHIQLITEQSEIVQRLANNIRYHVAKKGSQGAISADDETDSSNLPSGGSSPRNGTGEPDDLDYYKLKVKSEAKGGLQQTLFDEGLRIAQQYGMSDFAEELKGLKQGSDDSRDATENGNNNDEDKMGDNSTTWSCSDDSATCRGDNNSQKMIVVDSSTTQKSAYNLSVKHNQASAPTSGHQSPQSNTSASHVAIETS